MLLFSTALRERTVALAEQGMHTMKHGTTLSRVELEIAARPKGKNLR